MIDPSNFYPEDLDLKSLIIERFKKNKMIYERHSGLVNTTKGAVDWSIDVFIMFEDDETKEQEIERFEMELKNLENKEQYEEAKKLAEKIKKLKK